MNMASLKETTILKATIVEASPEEVQEEVPGDAEENDAVLRRWMRKSVAKSPVVVEGLLLVLNPATSTANSKEATTTMTAGVASPRPAAQGRYRQVNQATRGQQIAPLWLPSGILTTGHLLYSVYHPW